MIGGPLDTSKPNSARMYDYVLGGKDNFAADREAADKILKMSPDGRAAAFDNRGFLRRAVRYVTQSGVSQFIDIGSGLPTVENTHEVALAADPGARTAYIDNDPVVIAHAQAMLADSQRTTAVGGDLNDPVPVISELSRREFIDFARPVAVLLVAVMHFIGDDCYFLADLIKRQMAPGSYLIMSHATNDGAAKEELDSVESVYADASAPLYLRSRWQIGEFFDGFNIIEPGIVNVANWKSPRQVTSRPICYGGVGRKN